MLRLCLLLVTTASCCFALPKCCDSDSVLRKSNSSYYCEQSTTLRTAIVTDVTGVADDDDFCMDIDNGTIGQFFFNSSDSFTKEKDLDVDFFPKCCPLDFFYNTTTHGCVKSPTKLTPFFAEKFVKVGLPQCTIIMDIGLSISKNLVLQNGTLHLSKLNKMYNQGPYCVDKNEKGFFMVRLCQDDYDVCATARCIRKCCPDGQSFTNGSICTDTYVHGLDFSTLQGNMDDVQDSFVVVHGYNPPLYPLFTGKYTFYLNRDGIFTQKQLESTLTDIKVTKYYSVEEEAYCIEHGVKKSKGMNGFFFFRGFPKVKPFLLKFFYTSIAMAISCVFLALTILYYCFSKEKRTVFGKILISYCSISLYMFLLLSYLVFREKITNNISCTVLSFLVFYGKQSMFTWMNIMCIDIYWTFGSSKSFASRQQGNEWKRFLWYSLYGWGAPLVLTAIPITLYHTQVLPANFQIIINDKKCLLYKGEGNYGSFLFSTIPEGILELCNIVLFIKTATYCLKVKKEISKMNDTNVVKGEKSQKFNSFKQRFGLLLKLFLIMGISFTFEVVSEFCSFKKNKVTAVIEIIWDTINSLQGLFIFMIFIAKKRIFMKCGKQIDLNKLRKFSMVSSGITQSTSVPALGNKQ